MPHQNVPVSVGVGFEGDVGNRDALVLLGEVVEGPFGGEEDDGLFLGVVGDAAAAGEEGLKGVEVLGGVDPAEEVPGGVFES